MKNGIDIRSEIKKCIQEAGHTLRGFSKASGIFESHLSMVLNNYLMRPLGMTHLDRINQTLGKPEGCFYDLYVDECFISGKPHRSRVKPFMLRCAELGKQKEINQVLSRMMDDLDKLPLVFEIAEEIYAGGNPQGAVPFYECVAENERHQHDENLAISQYRLFRTALGKDNDANLKAVIRFEPYRNRVPENYQLDGLLQMINVYFNLGMWKEVEFFSEELCNLSETLYRLDLHKRLKSKKYEPLQTERHLVVYYGYSSLMPSVSLENQGKYQKALDLIANYADLSWFENLGEVGEKEVAKFTMWAEANRYTLHLLLGNAEILPSYTSFLKDKHIQEILPGLITIVDAANKHQISIDDVLLEFSDEIQLLKDREYLRSEYYEERFNLSRCSDLCYQLALYYFYKKSNDTAINNVLKSMEMAIIIKQRDVVRCISLFEEHRVYATSKQQMLYESMLKEVRELGENSQDSRDFFGVGG
ncbi:DNA-binding protein [Paenibacillus sp. 8b26]|uniref:DNA-binding protein n=1 Tax=Paenibacillus sp. 8b26 TaxID=3424133 RepID=UPI003D64D2A1